MSYTCVTPGFNNFRSIQEPLQKKKMGPWRPAFKDQLRQSKGTNIDGVSTTSY